MLKALTNKQTYNPQGEDRRNIAMHYLLWDQKCKDLQMQSVAESAVRWQENNSIVTDASEIAAWRLKHAVTPTSDIQLPFPCFLKLHAEYGSLEIKAALGLATLESTGATGVGVLHAPEHKCYIHLITFNKDARFFAPSTRYEDYAISDTKLHWESQSNTTQISSTGQNYIYFKERGYTILFFARLDRSVDGTTAPFFYLGPAKDLISYDGNRPISMVWELEYPMPAVLLQEAKPAAC